MKRKATRPKAKVKKRKERVVLDAKQIKRLRIIHANKHINGFSIKDMLQKFNISVPTLYKHVNG